MPKTGHTFGNYTPPAGEWGDGLTPDDIRYTFLYGVDLVANNGQEVEDEQLRYMSRVAVAFVERSLGLTIRKRIFKTRPAASLVRAKEVGPGVDYTDEEDTYAYDSDTWANGYAFLQLRHRPVISVESAVLKSPVDTDVILLSADNWTRLQKQAGQCYFYPRSGVGTLTHGPFLGAYGTVVSRFRGYYPDGYFIDYTAGYETANDMPEDLREAVSKIATVGTLQWVGDGLLAGFSSSSISMDGLSESFSSTQSATSAYFGARILSLQKEWKELLKELKRKYQNLPIEFC